MDRIQLDLTKLLGFKIIDGGPEGIGTLQSPKIGVKQCPGYENGAAIGGGAARLAKSGAMTD